MRLIIVSTPAQAKMLRSLLGESWRIEVCMGTAVDLPADKLGIDIEPNFRPTYVARQPRIAKRLTKAIYEAEAIYIATEPTMEAEAQAWRLLKLAQTPGERPVMRVTLRGLTREGILAALATPRPLDKRLIEAAETLRTAERLTGYLLTPLARQALGADVSVGYLTSLALKQLAEHKAEPPSRWLLRARFETRTGEAFHADLITPEGRRVTYDVVDKGEQQIRMLRTAASWVADLAERKVAHEPAPPHTLQTLIQAAPFAPSRTLSLAGGLYARGLITSPLIDDAFLLPTDQTPSLAGDACALYDLIFERAKAADDEPTIRKQRYALIRAWWVRDQSVWLTFRARDSDTPLPALVEHDSVYFSEGELVPVGTTAPLTETAIATVLYTLGTADLATAIAAVTALTREGYAEAVEGALRLTERGAALNAWLDQHFADVFMNDHAISVNQIATGKLSRLDALRAFWSRLQPALGAASAVPQPEPRPLILHPVEA